MTYGHAAAAKRGVPNVVHASADAQEAKKEIAHWFAEDEIVEYDTAQSGFTQPRHAD
jgi:hypothetical protein